MVDGGLDGDPSARERVSVLVAGPDDVGTLVRLRRAWIESDAGSPIDDDGFEAGFREWWAAERATRTFFVVEVDGEAVGMANVKRYDRMPAVGRPGGSRWGYVGNVFVLAAHRNAGVGQRLMEVVIGWAREEGLDHLRLAPSPRSTSFYARLGFAPGAVVELDP